MFKCLINYNFTPDKEFLGDDYVIYDRSDSSTWLEGFPEDKIIKTDNRGNVDHDKLNYLIDNYHKLPEVFLWGKTNLFKYITKEEYELVKDNQTFTPLLTQNHKVYSDKLGQVCYYSGGMYFERNDNWYVHEMDYHIPTFNHFTDYLNLPRLGYYLPFPPGGNYILTRERVHRYGIDLYKRMADTLPFTKLPAEAHMCERLYYSLWK